MENSFRLGDRVRVAESYSWAKGALGTVRDPPSYIRQLVERPEAGGAWQDHRRTITSLRGPITFYWIEFDTAQQDVDGDGPYQAGEIDVNYLQPVIDHDS